MIDKLIIRQCKYHGDLTIDDMIKSGFTDGKQRYKCKKCMKVIHHNNYLKNKTTIDEKRKLHKAANREYYRKMNMRYSMHRTYANRTSSVKLDKPIIFKPQIEMAKKRLINILMQINEVERYVNK